MHREECQGGMVVDGVGHSPVSQRPGWETLCQGHMVSVFNLACQIFSVAIIQLRSVFLAEKQSWTTGKRMSMAVFQ